MITDTNLFGEVQPILGQRVRCEIPISDGTYEIIGNLANGETLTPNTGVIETYSEQNVICVVVDLLASEITHEELEALPDFFTFTNGEWIARVFDFECEVVE